MSTVERYPIPVQDVRWLVPEEFDAHFAWEYEDTRKTLMTLCERGKSQQRLSFHSSPERQRVQGGAPRQLAQPGVCGVMQPRIFRSTCLQALS